jgi:hypothetical protein
MGWEIINLYQKFWMGFHVIIRDRRVVPTATLAFKQIGGTFILSSPIGLISWPCRKDPSNKVDIVVEYQMTVVQHPKGVHHVKSSTGTVLYFLGGIGSRPPVQIVRFEHDPSCGMDDGDPLFHAQLGSKTGISIQILPEVLQKRWKYQNHQKSSNDSHVRIPTPRMLLPDLLCFIVADHLRGRVHAVVEKTSESLTQLTKLVCDESYMGREFWNHIPAPNWYRRGG